MYSELGVYFAIDIMSSPREFFITVTANKKHDIKHTVKLYEHHLNESDIVLLKMALYLTS